MNYDQLDDRAKERARDWYREHNLEYEWWDYIFEEADNVSKFFGITLDRRYRIDSKGKQIDEGPDISFHGFSVQGSGCCFSGQIAVEHMENAQKVLKEQGIKDNKLIELGDEAVRIYDATIVAWAANKLKGEEEPSGHPDEAVFEISGRDRSWTTELWNNYHDDPEWFITSLEKQYDDFVSSFADWIYNQLEAEYDHLTSDEYIEESIRTNDYQFDEEGNVHGH